MKITVVIPNYNGRQYLKPCLDALAAQHFRDFQILVVDNASTDGSVSYIKAHYPAVQVLALKKNGGFSRAVNAGIRWAHTPYVFLLNNDTRMHPDCLQNSLKAMERSPRIFSVAAKMIQMKHPRFLDSAGDSYTVIGWGVRRGLDEPVNAYLTAEPVFSACAGAALYRRKIFRRIGLFDEHFFAYREDMDIGYRARIYGYQNLYCPDAVVEHVGSATSGSRYNAFKVRLSARNGVYLNYKNMPLPQLVFNLLPLCAGHIVKYAFFRKNGLSQAYREGLWEGLRTCKRVKKVPLQKAHLARYLKIEAALIAATVPCIRSALRQRP